MNASSVIEEVARSIAHRAINAIATTTRTDTSAIDQNRFPSFFPGISADGADAFAGGAGAAPAVEVGGAELTGWVTEGPSTRASCHATTRPNASSTIYGYCRATYVRLIRPAGVHNCR